MKGSYGISDLMDADYEVASNEAAAPEASAYEDGFGMTEGYDPAENAQDTSTTVPEETAATVDRKSNFIYGTGTFRGDSDRLCGCSGKPSENAADGFCRFSKRCADK